MLRQRSLREPVCTTGVGLHSGERVRLCLKPAPVDSGIVFWRSDLDPPLAIAAKAQPLLIVVAKAEAAGVKGSVRHANCHEQAAEAAWVMSSPSGGSHSLT
ncbi:MAG: UDP-3-O-acyl-N-acetylglucosamine deacetylase, partial [Burkholderiales bacterium]